MNANTFSKVEKNILLFLGIALFVYIAIRAFFVPIVHDEAATYFYYIQTHNWLPYQAHWDANNHLINSALGSFFIQLFGTDVWVLRLGSLLFLPLYLFYTYFISGLLQNKYLRLGLILSLWFAHYFIEFLGYSRGYGISMALVVAALYYTILFIQNINTKYLLLALVFNVFALAANLSLLNSFLLINGILFLICAVNFKQINRLITSISFLLLSIIPGLYFVRYLFEMKTRGLLYYGSEKGFVEVTLKSVTRLIVGFENNYILLFISLLFAAILITYIAQKIKQLKSIKPVDVFVAMLVGNVVIILLLGIILHVNYPEDRVGMYLYLYIALAAFFVADAIQHNAKYLLVLPFLYFPIQFGFAANITHSKLWYEEHIPERFFNKIATYRCIDDCYPPVVSGYSMRLLVWSYYNQQKHGKQNEIEYIGYENNLLSDYIISRKNEIKGWQQYYTEIDFDAISGLSLLQRNTFLEEGLLYTSPTNNFDNQCNEYFNFFEINTDTLAGKNIRINIHGLVKIYSDSLLNGRIIVSLTDSINADYGTYNTQLSWQQLKQPNGEYKIKYSYLIPNISPKVTRIIVYYWNIDKQKISLLNAKATVLEVKN